MTKLLFFQFLFKKMSNSNSKYITVKYYAESEYAKKSYQALEDSAG